MRENENYPAGSIFNLQGMTEIEFDSLKRTLFSILPKKATESKKKETTQKSVKV